MDLTSYNMYGMDGGLMALGIGMIIGLAVLVIAFYVYLGFAFMHISRRAKKGTPGLAWIPFVGPLIVTYQISGMHWWPWLLLLSPILLFTTYLIPLVFVATAVFWIFCLIWMWKTFEAVGRPGWWVIVPLIGGVLAIIPVVGRIIYGLSALAYFVFIGLAAWGGKKKAPKKTAKPKRKRRK